MQIKAKILAECKIRTRDLRFQQMRFIIAFIAYSTILSIYGCEMDTNKSALSEKNGLTDTLKKSSRDTLVYLPYRFTRDSIVSGLNRKVDQNAARIIHVFVPLCDNEHQGIVPVNASLGNGMNLRTNLYWGAGYGIKTHFVRSSDWEKISSVLNPSTNVLERVVFKHTSQNVFMVADAYRGDKMKDCLQDYFGELAGKSTDTLYLKDSTKLLSANVDLVVFNGHNGLMDTDIETIYNIDGRTKDAVAIACVSHSFYAKKLNESGGYPLVMTSNLLAPEAYVLDNVFNAWIKNLTEEEIRFAAATGYNNVQKCGIRGASNLFVTGWGKE